MSSLGNVSSRIAVPFVVASRRAFYARTSNTHLLRSLDGVLAIVVVHLAAIFPPWRLASFMQYGEAPRGLSRDQLQCVRIRSETSVFPARREISIARYREVVRNLIAPGSDSFLESVQGNPPRRRTDRGELNGVRSRRLQPSAGRASAKFTQPISVSGSLGESSNSWKSRRDITRSGSRQCGFV